MFDFTDGSTWFFSGLTVTLFFLVLVLVFALVATRVEHR